MLEVLQQLTPGELQKVVLRLVDRREYKRDRDQLSLALKPMSDILAMEDLGIEYSGARPISVPGSPTILSSEELSAEGSASRSEADFLERQFSDEIDVGKLSLDPVVTTILQARIDEVQACPARRCILARFVFLAALLKAC